MIARPFWIEKLTSAWQKRPRVYAFDTGFVAFARGWDRIREDDRGLLWEHLVLDTLRVSTGGSGLFYWRDKSGREIDFVVSLRGEQVHAVECKMNPDRFDPESLRVLRQAYPTGRNYVICPAVEESYQRQSGGLTINIGGCRTLPEEFG